MADGDSSMAMAPMTDALAPDPTARLREPLLALLIVIPLGLTGEAMRAFGHGHGGAAVLLGDGMFRRIGGLVGILPPLVPLALLAIGGLGLHAAQRRRWEMPATALVAATLLWAFLWAALRVLVAVTALRVRGEPGGDVVAATGDLLAQAGLGLVGAVQEELLFRAVLLGGLLAVGRACRLPAGFAAGVAVALSAAVFSLAHTPLINHTIAAEPFAWPAVVERAAAGVLYGLAFIRHGLGACTLAHATWNVALVSGLARWL